FIDKQKEMGNALTDEQVKKVHEFEDAWISALAHIKIAAVDAFTWLNTPMLLQSKVDPSRYGFNYGTQFGPRKPTSIPDANGTNEDVKDPNAKPVKHELDDYITNLQGEAAALAKSKDALTLYKAEQEGASKAR